MRHMQHQYMMEAMLQQTQQQTEQTRGASPTVTARTERSSQNQQLNMRGFDIIASLSRGEEQWENWVLEDQDGCVRNEQRIDGSVGCGQRTESRTSESLQDEDFVGVNKDACAKECVGEVHEFRGVDDREKRDGS